MIRERRAIPAAFAAGLCLTAALPPIGWWPLGFLGWALIDLLVFKAPTWARFRRLALAAFTWFTTAMLWMWDMTPPGYVAAVCGYAVLYGLVGVVCPNDWRRRLVLPAAVVVVEWFRWSWPFGGVPLANPALSQIDTPWASLLRVTGPLGLVAAAVIGGQLVAVAVSWRTERPKSAAFAPLALVAALAIAGALHPRAAVADTIDVALVQGGGPQRTRASVEKSPVVLGRHLEASKLITEPVDFVLWPENVVNVNSSLTFEEASSRLQDLADRFDAPVSAGWFHRANEPAVLPGPDLPGGVDPADRNVNYQALTLPDGALGDRYDKVKLVPFGEYMPLRSFIEASPLGPLAAEAASRDVIPGIQPAVLQSPFGPVGTLISWEGFFDTRARSAVAAGAVVLTNPTNGSSFWLDQIHTQQVASNRMWALAYDRWSLQVGPTGLTAIIDADGAVLAQTELRDREVLQSEVELRTGRTVASRLGPWPVGLLSLATLLVRIWRR